MFLNHFYVENLNVIAKTIYSGSLIVFTWLSHLENI